MPFSVVYMKRSIFNRLRHVVLFASTLCLFSCSQANFRKHLLHGNTNHFFNPLEFRNRRKHPFYRGLPIRSQRKEETVDHCESFMKDVIGSSYHFLPHT